MSLFRLTSGNQLQSTFNLCLLWPLSDIFRYLQTKVHWWSSLSNDHKARTVIHDGGGRNHVYIDAMPILYFTNSGTMIYCLNARAYSIVSFQCIRIETTTSNRQNHPPTHSLGGLDGNNSLHFITRRIR